MYHAAMTFVQMYNQKYNKQGRLRQMLKTLMEIIFKTYRCIYKRATKDREDKKRINIITKPYIYTYNTNLCCMSDRPTDLINHIVISAM